MMSEEAFSAPSNIRGTLVDPNSNSNPNPNPNNSNPVVKRKRSLPGTPDPDAEVIALSPKSLMATNRFICEICKKGFQRDQNLQLHRRGHNLPWKLRQRTSQEVVRKKVYVCPEKSCVHNDPSRALGDLTGIKKHYSRKHGEKKWKCDKCSKKYAVQSDWKAHTKICGTREYRCDCGTLFSRKDSFITHRAFCEALADQSARIMTSVPAVLSNLRNDHHLINAQTPRIMPHHHHHHHHHHQSLLGFQHEFVGSVPEPLMGNLADADHGGQQKLKLPLWLDQANNSSVVTPMPDLVQTMNMFGSSSSSQVPWLMNYRYPSEAAASSFTSDNNNNLSSNVPTMRLGVMKREQEENKGELLLSHSLMSSSLYSNCQNQQGGSSHHMSATALLQKATQMESTRINDDNVAAAPAFNNNNNNNIVEIQKIFKQGNQAESFNNEMVSCQANIGGAFSLNLSSPFVIEDQWQDRQPPILGKQLHSRSNDDEDQFGLTRDFLGVGDDSLSRPFLQQELAKFDSMGSVMNLQSHFGGHN